MQENTTYEFMTKYFSVHIFF